MQNKECKDIEVRYNLIDNRFSLVCIQNIDLFALDGYFLPLALHFNLNAVEVIELATNVIVTSIDMYVAKETSSKIQT